MEIHAYPLPHVHGCPVHPDGAGSTGGLTADGKRNSDACFWHEHSDTFKLAHKAEYDAAVRR